MNDQETLWAGRFGDEYHARQAPGSNLAFFARALERVDREPEEILELGCGDGRNLSALGLLLPNTLLRGVEINAGAAEKAQAVAKVWQGSVLALPIMRPMLGDSIVVTKGFLIHVSPQDLQTVYLKMAACMSRWLLICEYFSPEPREIVYRGQEHALWTRDYGPEVAAAVGGRIIDCWFAPKSGKWPQDNLTVWLIER